MKVNCNPFGILDLSVPYAPVWQSSLTNGLTFHVCSLLFIISHTTQTFSTAWCGRARPVNHPGLLCLHLHQLPSLAVLPRSVQVPGCCCIKRRHWLENNHSCSVTPRHWLSWRGRGGAEGSNFLPHPQLELGWNWYWKVAERGALVSKQSPATIKHFTSAAIWTHPFFLSVAVMHCRDK